MIKYIIVKVCCFDCNRYKYIEIYDTEELIKFFEKIIKEKEIGEKEDNYYIYTIEGDLIFKI